MGYIKGFSGLEVFHSVSRSLELSPHAMERRLVTQLFVAVAVIILSYNPLSPIEAKPVKGRPLLLDPISQPQVVKPLSFNDIHPFHHSIYGPNNGVVLKDHILERAVGELVTHRSTMAPPVGAKGCDWNLWMRAVTMIETVTLQGFLAKEIGWIERDKQLSNLREEVITAWWRALSSCTTDYIPYPKTLTGKVQLSDLNYTLEDV